VVSRNWSSPCASRLVCVDAPPTGLAQVPTYGPANLDNFGITLSKVDVPAGTQPILPGGTIGLTSGEAVEAASQHAEAVDARHNLLPNVAVTAAYGLLTDSHIQQMTSTGEVPVFQDAPVWIVTFVGSGVNIPSSGPPTGPEYVHHEETVVVDAGTGRFLFSVS
jgi:hypothetical protein